MAADNGAARAAPPAAVARPSAPPRVLHVIGGAAVGGTERQLLMLLPGLAQATDARVVVLRGGPLTDAYAAVVPTSVIAKVGKLDPVSVARLIAAMRRHRPHIVHTWGSTANLWGSVAARAAGVPRVVVSDGSLDAWKGRVLRRADAVVYGWADAVVGNSAAVVDASVGRGAPRARSRVISNGVVIPPAPAAPDDRDRDLVLFLGRLHPDKGPDVLLDAVPELVRRRPGIRVVLAGTATQRVERALRAQLEHRVAELGLADRVQLPGPVDQPAALLRRAAVLVVPSRTEGSPNVVLEAMAEGTPVVAAAVGGVPELVDDATGWTVGPEDPAALASTLLQALADDGERSRRAMNARVRIERDFALDRVVQRWSDLYVELVGAEPFAQ